MDANCGILCIMDVITSHINTDFDSLASAIAVKKLYPEAVIVFPGSMEKKVRDFMDVFQPVEIKKLKDISMDEVRRLIIVDTKHPGRIGAFKELLFRPGVEVHVYDHHPPAKEDIRGEVEVIDTTGAVSTVFAEIIQARKFPLSTLEATILCLGIYQETGSLMFTSTTPRDLIAAAYLIRQGANLNIVSDFLKEEISREEFSLLNELVKSLDEVVVQGVRIKIGKGTMEGFGDVAHLAHQIMNMEEADAVILLIGMADKILMVARSRAPELDAARIMAEFGGGGHPTAASATIKDVPFEIVEEKLAVALRKHIRPARMVRDVMTTPVIVVQWNNDIREAELVMTRYGVNALPVVKEDGYLGIITRGVVEKALFHGLGENRCVDFATTDALTTAPDTPVAEVEKDMIEHNQRFVTVLSEGRIAGAVTRTDILRALYEAFLRKSKVSPREPGTTEVYSGFGRSIARMLREKLPVHTYESLVMAGEVGDELGFGVYLVGGCVRDMLRGVENPDIDIVAEGDGIALARALAKKTGAKIRVHHKFGTAQVILPMLRLDVATARTEYYESPAALPKVETSSIKKDLYRRDFTINTLAVKLNKKNFGLLLDFFGGQRDLKEKLIRVLHNLSFVEDPTRAFRAIRFSERFGFKLTKHTENLIKLALRMNIFEKLSGSRLYDELMLTFMETYPIKALKRLSDYGLLKVIHNSLTFSSWLEEFVQSVHDSIAWFDLLFLEERYQKGMLYLSALLYKLNKEDRESALGRLAVPPKPREHILKTLNIVPNILKKLKADSPVNIYHTLKDCDIEAILFSMALSKDSDNKKAISHFLLELRDVKPLVKGGDLKKIGIPPGPLYSDVFRKIVDEKLRGRLATREEEVTFVKNIWKG
ncbi:MAG TPA: CBS domain-containing protein [Dissulfurispiraceae bacterium]|nr:CBS domain-containing protein [Dissulfurispiraceae bacterium]